MRRRKISGMMVDRRHIHMVPVVAVARVKRVAVVVGVPPVKAAMAWSVQLLFLAPTTVAVARGVVKGIRFPVVWAEEAQSARQVLTDSVGAVAAGIAAARV